MQNLKLIKMEEALLLRDVWPRRPVPDEIWFDSGEGVYVHVLQLLGQTGQLRIRTVRRRLWPEHER